MKFLLSLYYYLTQFGCNPLYFISAAKNIFRYIRDFIQIKRKQTKDFKIFPNHPCLHDKTDDSGTAKGHYFHQDILVAQKIFKKNPERHIDIGSRIDGFIAHIASFREVEVFDIRPNKNDIHNITFLQGDITQLDEKRKNSCDSISSLHAIEHFGLGRYGDPLDINGHLKGIKNISSMLKKGGTFYFSVPIGPQRIEFNAHRVFSLQYLTKIIKDIYMINSFSYVNDQGELHKNIELTEDLIKNNCNCWYGCGIFELQKL